MKAAFPRKPTYRSASLSQRVQEVVTALSRNRVLCQLPQTEAGPQTVGDVVQIPNRSGEDNIHSFAFTVCIRLYGASRSQYARPCIYVYTHAPKCCHGNNGNHAVSLQVLTGATVNRKLFELTQGGKKVRHVRRFRETIWRHASESNPVRKARQEKNSLLYF